MCITTIIVDKAVRSLAPMYAQQELDYLEDQKQIKAMKTALGILICLVPVFLLYVYLIVYFRHKSTDTPSVDWYEPHSYTFSQRYYFSCKSTDATIVQNG